MARGRPDSDAWAAAALVLLLAPWASASHLSDETVAIDARVAVEVLEECPMVGAPFQVQVEWENGNPNATVEIGYRVRIPEFGTNNPFVQEVPLYSRSGANGTFTFEFVANYTGFYEFTASLVPHWEPAHGGRLVAMTPGFRTPGCGEVVARDVVEIREHYAGPVAPETAHARLEWLGACFQVDATVWMYVEHRTGDPSIDDLRRRFYVIYEDGGAFANNTIVYRSSLMWLTGHNVSAFVAWVPPAEGNYTFQFDYDQSNAGGVPLPLSITRQAPNATNCPSSSGGFFGGLVSSCAGFKGNILCNAWTLTSAVLVSGGLGAWLVGARRRREWVPEVPLGVIGAGVAALAVSFLFREPWLWGWI